MRRASCDGERPAISSTNQRRTSCTRVARLSPFAVSCLTTVGFVKQGVINLSMASASRSIKFIDLAAQHSRVGEKIAAAIARVTTHGEYVLGPEIRELESQLSAFCGTEHAVTCASGTDALVLSLVARGVGPSDAILVPSFTFAATAESVVRAGAKIIFVDVLPDTFNVDPTSVGQGVAAAKKLGLKPTAVVPVDLFVSRATTTA